MTLIKLPNLLGFAIENNLALIEVQRYLGARIPKVVVQKQLPPLLVREGYYNNCPGFPKWGPWPVRALGSKAGLSTMLWAQPQNRPRLHSSGSFPHHLHPPTLYLYIARAAGPKISITASKEP